MPIVGGFVDAQAVPLLGTPNIDQHLAVNPQGTAYQWQNLFEDWRNFYKAQLPSLQYVLGTNMTETVVGSGVSSLNSGYVRLRTGITVSSSIVRTTLGFGYRQASPDTLNFSREFGAFFILARDIADTQAVSNIKFATATTIGDLAAAGLQIKIAGYTMTGQSYQTGLGDLSLVTMNNFQSYAVLIRHNPANSKVEFWVNGTLQATNSTAGQVPTGNPSFNLTVGHSNGAAGTSSDLYVSNILLMQGAT